MTLPDFAPARSLLLGSASLALAACTAASSAGQDSAEATPPGVLADDAAVSGDQGGRLHKGDYSSPLWLSDAFDGEHERRFDGEDLVLTMTQRAQTGGLDTALATAEGELPPVGEVSDDLVVCFAYDVDLEGEGHWWAGPKISVNWNRDAEVETTGWHETYIVEVADDAPDVIEARMKDYWDVTFLGETEQDGSVYRHFTFPFEEWDQYWAIRQDYRTEGATSIGPILAKWQEGGLSSTEPMDGVKINIETYGPMAGTVRIGASIPQSYKTPGQPCTEA